MRVYLLGTGTLEVQADRASTGLAFEEQGELLLVDCGRNVLSRAVECGLDPLRASALLLTHLHPDHTCELVSLLFSRNYHRPQGRPPLEPMRILGPTGTRTLVESIAAAWRWCRPGPRIRVDEIDANWTECFGALRVTAHRMSHGDEPALGYRVCQGAASVAFTGDTGLDPSWLPLAEGVDLLIAECGRRPGDDRGAHLGAEELLELIERARPSRVVLTHFYPEIDRFQVLETLRGRTPSEIVLGEDRMGFDVGGK